MCPHTTNLRSCVAAQILKHLWGQRVDQQFGRALVGTGCWVYMVALFRVAIYIQAVITCYSGSSLCALEFERLHIFAAYIKFSAFFYLLFAMIASVSLVNFVETIEGADKSKDNCMAALPKNEITDIDELRFADMALIKEIVGAMTAGLHAFMSRLLYTYSVKFGAVSEQAGPLSAALNVNPAKRVVPSRMHIDLAVNINGGIDARGKQVLPLSVIGLNQRCWPHPTLVDALAPELATLKT